MRDGVVWAVWDRTFAAGPDDVWAAVTEPARLARWIGTWTGDPRTGSVEFLMTAEGEDVTPETFTIDVCEPPATLRTRSRTPDDPETEWCIAIDVVPEGECTRLTFAMAIEDPAIVGGVGPGWEYYLDRLVVAEGGGDVTKVDFVDYHPALSAPYEAMFRT